MMIIRDVKVCWICSIIFELLEVSFRHWLPNFWECWWDSILSPFGDIYPTLIDSFIRMTFLFSSSGSMMKLLIEALSHRTGYWL
jgi:hypothetical protein